MRGHPHRGDVYRRGYLPPGDLTVLAGTFRRPLASVEWSPTEPEKKYYARGIGEIAEKVTQGGHKAFKLRQRDIPRNRRKPDPLPSVVT